MKFGIREVADVMVKTRVNNQKVGGQVIAKAMTPICHFDSLKTSSLEGAATTVYAQGGKGNSRLIAWEGDKTLTLTMEDALISKAGIALLTGADLIDTSLDGTTKTTTIHVTETVVASSTTLTVDDIASGTTAFYAPLDDAGIVSGAFKEIGEGATVEKDKAYLLDYYKTTETTDSILLVDIEPEAFGGNYYFEGATLWRDTNGIDYPAEFIVPNGHIQSNFTFAMSSSGDPSAFTFTVDALPGTTVYNRGKKVLAAMQIVQNATENTENDSTWLEV